VYIATRTSPGREEKREPAVFGEKKEEEGGKRTVGSELAEDHMRQRGREGKAVQKEQWNFGGVITCLSYFTKDGKKGEEAGGGEE